MSLFIRRSTLVLALSITACQRAPVQWRDPVAVSGTGDSLRLAIDDSGSARLVRDSTLVRSRPRGSAVCPDSFRAARGAHDLFAAWWSVRSDSSAVLYAAVSEDSGATWRARIAVDTADISSRGCRRPAPSIAAVADTVHIAYSMVAKEGTGVFFAHSMERGRMFHAPVAVEYGDRLAATAIAGDGSMVAVAFEQPSGRRAEVDVALSRTLGHIFDARIAASRSDDEAVDPLVAISGRHIAVSWVERGAGTADSSSGTRMVRVGTLR